MNKTNLKKSLVALMIVATCTTAYAGDGVNGLNTNGAINDRNALDSLLFHLAQTMMERTAVPTEPVSTVRIRAKSAPMTRAKTVPAPTARANMVTSNN